MHSAQFADISDSDSLDGQTCNTKRTGTLRARNPSSKSGACIHCKSLKVRCEFSPHQTVCQRCQAGNFECLARSRKKRKPAPTHEDLQERANDQDRQIEILLARFDQMKARIKIQALMGEGYLGPEPLDSLSVNSSPELAAASYFSRRPNSVGYLTTPPIVKCCGLYPAEIMDLFAIFFERINPFFSILDPDLHASPSDVIWTSPFLFTAICATASRFYTLRPDLYPKAHGFARDAASAALIDGAIGVDICQAYLILAVYPIQKKKFVDDRSWLFMGVAIRMAIELGLHQPPPPACGERESLNRTRTWLNCYCVDASHAIQFGKLPMLGLDDYIARTSRDWYKSSLLNMNGPFDVHLCAYVSFILLMAEWRRTVKDRKMAADFDIIASSIQAQNKLAQEQSHWASRFDRDFIIHPLPICTYRVDTNQMISAYLRLVILADGFQHATKKGLSRNSEILRLSTEAAQTVIQIALDRLYPSGNLRYALDANFLYVTFAAGFLMNLLRPRFLPLVKENTQQRIVLLVRKLIDVLGSDSVALDGRHTPALYSRFLSSLLAKYNVFPLQHPDSPPTEGTKFYPQFESDHAHTPSHVCSWPDITYNGNVSPLASEGSDDFMIYQRSGDPDIDLSLNHFIRTVNAEQTNGDGFAQPRIPSWNSAWGIQV